MKLGLIGYGAVADLLLDTLAVQLTAPLDALVCLAKPGGRSRAEAMVARIAKKSLRTSVVLDRAALIASVPDLIVEAASQQAIRDHGVAILQAGIDLVVTSVGALADEALHRALLDATAQTGARLHLPAGAVGGIDILAAARLSGIEQVMYTSRKPPLAWQGTPAEDVVDLALLDREAVFYEGNAREAARDYPKNANVAATVAIAGAGFDQTRVRLIADPAVDRNIHELSVRSRCTNMVIRIEGLASPSNPKTSLCTGYSVARAVLNHMACEVI